MAVMSNMKFAMKLMIAEVWPAIRKLCWRKGGAVAKQDLTSGTVESISGTG
jgi:hypothetical protein